MSASQLLRLSSALDRMGASPDNKTMENESDDKQTCLSPKVRFNEELNGYHFHFFKETFICREALPKGSETFRKVLEEVTDELDTVNISDQPVRLSPNNNRRKSVATIPGKFENHVSSEKSQKKRRVSWGKPVHLSSDNTEQQVSSSMSAGFRRQRVASDGAVTRRKSITGR